jgi:hypothetical protein
LISWVVQDTRAFNPFMINHVVIPIGIRDLGKYTSIIGSIGVKDVLLALLKICRVKIGTITTHKTALYIRAVIAEKTVRINVPETHTNTVELATIVFRHNETRGALRD